MNFDALEEIINNCVELLEVAAQDNNLDEKVIKGIAEYAARNGYQALSESQKYRFDQCIRGLIEDVACPTYIHEYDDEPRDCGNLLDDDDLVKFYQGDDVFCESCTGEASSDAHYKQSFFRD